MAGAGGGGGRRSLMAVGGASEEAGPESRSKARCSCSMDLWYQDVGVFGRKP